MILEDELPVVPAKKKRYTIQGKNCYKVKKGIVLANWLEKIKINKDAVKAIEEKAVTGKDSEIMLTCVDVLEEVVTKISEGSEVNSGWSPLVKGRMELPWSSKAYIIYFFLHPNLGNFDTALTSRYAQI